MGTLTIASFASGALSATDLNTAFEAIKTEYNGNIDNSNFTSLDGEKILDKSLTYRKIKLTAGIATATADLDLTTNYQDVTGATVTFTPTVASKVVVYAVFHFSGIVAGSNIAYGALDVDGTTQTYPLMIDNNNAGSLNGTFLGVWCVDATAAAHTFKLIAKTTAASADEKVLKDNTQIYYEIYSA